MIASGYLTVKKMKGRIRFNRENRGVLLPAIREWIEYQEEILKGGIGNEDK